VGVKVNEVVEESSEIETVLELEVEVKVAGAAEVEAAVKWLTGADCEGSRGRQPTNRAAQRPKTSAEISIFEFNFYGQLLIKFAILLGHG
jgi:hypothetical protein